MILTIHQRKHKKQAEQVNVTQAFYLILIYIAKQYRDLKTSHFTSGVNQMAWPVSNTV